MFDTWQVTGQVTLCNWQIQIALSTGAASFRQADRPIDRSTKCTLNGALYPPNSIILENLFLKLYWIQCILHQNFLNQNFQQWKRSILSVHPFDPNTLAGKWPGNKEPCENGFHQIVPKESLYEAVEVQKSPVNGRSSKDFFRFWIDRIYQMLREENRRISHRKIVFRLSLESFQWNSSGLWLKGCLKKAAIKSTTPGKWNRHQRWSNGFNKNLFFSISPNPFLK